MYQRTFWSNVAKWCLGFGRGRGWPAIRTTILSRGGGSYTPLVYTQLTFFFVTLSCAGNSNKVMFYEILSKISDWFVNDVRLTLDWSHLSGSVTSGTIDDDPEFFENNRVPSYNVGLWSVNIHQYQELSRKRDFDLQRMYLPWHTCVEDYIYDCVSYILQERPTRGNSHIKIGRGCSSQSLKRTLKRYQDPVLWAWFNFLLHP